MGRTRIPENSNSFENAKGEIREVFAETGIKELEHGYYIDQYLLGGACTVDAQEGDYLAIVSKEEGTDEYLEILGSDFEKVICLLRDSSLVHSK